MSPIEEIFYQFDLQKDPNDFIIWLNENRERLFDDEEIKLNSSFEDGYELGWDEALNKEND